MNVLVTGGTGFIGSALCRQLQSEGREVTVLTRDRRKTQPRLGTRIRAVESWDELADVPDAIVNLAGQNLASGRWNDALKQEFVTSRIGTTQAVVDYIAAHSARPKVLVSGSAVGYYGARGDETLDESDAPGNEFQADLCKAWEAQAVKAEDYGVRVCVLRTGLVLGRGGGALGRMLLPFKLGLGSYLGGGRQWMSWIHLYDMVGLIQYLLDHETLVGPFNATAPNPVTNRAFSMALGDALNRPVWFKIPGFVLQLGMGEMSDLLLTGQKVIPHRLLESGYRFKFPELPQALAEAVGAQ